MVVGIVLTLVACAAVWRAPGVYWAVTKVYFLPPPSMQPNQLAPDNGSPMALVGLIQDEINGGTPADGLNDPEVTLVDEGIYDGWAVRLPNYGGQWATDFRDPVLIVQASGASSEVVEERMDHLIARIRQLVAQREDEAAVVAAARVDFQLSPPVVAVRYSRGNRTRALAVMMSLGLTLSLTACVLVDRMARRRQTRGERHAGFSHDRLRHSPGSHQDGSGGA